MTAPASAPYTESLLGALRSLARGQGTLTLEARDLHGHRREELHIRANPEYLPASLTAALAEELGVTTPCVMQDGGAPVSLAGIPAVWRLQTRFSRETGWRHTVDPDNQARIRAALAGFPLPPAYLVDGGPIVWAWWALDAPVRITDATTPQIRQVLEGLALRLGGDWQIADDLTTMLPLCGIVRNFGGPESPERVDIEPVDPTTYTLEQLMTAAKETR
ncbi:MAG: hypothetical protein WC713_11790 [Candidatus Methylomirabilota bacterium]